MYRAISAITHLCLFVSFILLLLVSLSVPIIHSIWLVRANIHAGVSFLGASDSMTFGVWGLCLGRGQAHLFGMKLTSNGDCTKPKLGYSTEFASDKHVKNLIHGSTAKALVLFPLATALTFAALVTSIIVHLRNHRSEIQSRTGRVLSTLELVSTLLASFFASLAFIMGITVNAKASHTANQSDGLISTTYGSAIWMALVAAILLWFAKVASCWDIFQSRKRRAAAEKY